MVQAIVVFGANVDTLNSSGETARHLAATSNQSPCKDVILYMLNSVCAKRCPGRRINCTEGCSPDFTFNGVPPDNPSFLRNTRIFDPILMESIVKSAVEKANQSSNEDKNLDKKRVKLLSLDGGGIRGLILIQVLCYLESISDKPIVDLFDFMAGTSTGGILFFSIIFIFLRFRSLCSFWYYCSNQPTMLRVFSISCFSFFLSTFIIASECRQIYFRLKDKIFVGYRPYCSDTLERFLQRYLGEKKMNELTKPRFVDKVIIG